MFTNSNEFDVIKNLKTVWKSGISAEFPLTYYEDNKHAVWRNNFIFKNTDGHIINIYEDVTEKIILEEKEKLHNRDITLLNSSLLGFMKLTSEENIYEYIAEHLSKLSEDAIVIINSFDKSTYNLTTRAVFGIKDPVRSDN